MPSLSGKKGIKGEPCRGVGQGACVKGDMGAKGPKGYPVGKHTLTASYYEIHIIRETRDKKVYLVMRVVKEKKVT